MSAVSREDALTFVRQVAQLGPHAGKSWRTRGVGLTQLLAVSGEARITATNQRRTVSQVNHFLDWAVYEGELATNPFATVKVEAKGRRRSYAAMTDSEVTRLLAAGDPLIGDLLLFRLLSGMRAGEAVGLIRDDLLWKGRLGRFAWIRPNAVGILKTQAAERLVPLHSALSEQDRTDITDIIAEWLERTVAGA